MLGELQPFPRDHLIQLTHAQTPQETVHNCIAFSILRAGPEDNIVILVSWLRKLNRLKTNLSKKQEAVCFQAGSCMKRAPQASPQMFLGGEPQH